MAICNYVITVYAQEHNVINKQYPQMSIYFDNSLIANGITVQEISALTMQDDEYESVLPNWTKIKAGQDRPKNLSGDYQFSYSFIVSINDNIDSNKTTSHKIKFVLDNTDYDNCINIASIYINECKLSAEDWIGSIDNGIGNTELETSFTMPIYPHKKEVNLEGQKWKVEYTNLFPIPVSSRYFIKHECKEMVIEMIDDYYEKKEPNKYRQVEKRFLSIPSLKPLWITFQNAFDDHCEKFNLPKVIIRASWFIWYSKTDSIQSHIHPGAVLVGTYYLHADKNSPPVVLEHPFHNTISSNNISRIGGHNEIINEKYNTEEYKIEEVCIHPKSEMFNIFPGYLRHCVRPTNQVHHRYVVVANAVLRSESERYANE